MSVISVFRVDASSTSAWLSCLINEITRGIARVVEGITPAHEHADFLNRPANVEERGVVDFIITSSTFVIFKTKHVGGACKNEGRVLIPEIYVDIFFVIAFGVFD